VIDAVAKLNDSFSNVRLMNIHGLEVSTVLCLNDIQLTAENVEGAVESLSAAIGKSENNEAGQNDEVLGNVADYFTQLEDFLTKPNANITNTV
jgi:hypothetical protein